MVDPSWCSLMAAAMICADTTFCGCVVSADALEWILVARQSVTAVNVDCVLTVHPRKSGHKCPWEHQTLSLLRQNFAGTWGGTHIRCGSLEPWKRYLYACQSSTCLHSIQSKQLYGWRPTQWWSTTLTAVRTNARAGSGNGLNDECCLMPSSFLLANHMVLMIFWMISALRKPRRLSCMSALCCPPTHQ